MTRRQHVAEIIFAKVGPLGKGWGMKAGRGIRSLGWAALLVGAVVGSARAADGDLLKSFATATTGSAGIVGAPAIDNGDGSVYVAVAADALGGPGLILAFESGLRKKKDNWPAAGFSTPRGVESTPLVGPDHAVYFGCLDGNLYALNGDTGQPKWAKVRVGVRSVSSPVLSADGATIYVGSGGTPGDTSNDDNGLHALRASDGKLLWTVRTSDDVQSAAAVGTDGTVYFGSVDNSIFAVRPTDGFVKWTRSTGDVVLSSPAIGADGTVYIGSDDGYMYALKPESGELKWKFFAGDAIRASPVIGPDGVVYFGAINKNFYAVNPDGSSHWDRPVAVGGAIYSTAVVRSDGIVIFGADDGQIHALRADTGTSQWNSVAARGEPIDSAVVVDREGIIYVGVRDGVVYGFTGSGAQPSLYSRWPTFGQNSAHTGQAPVLPQGGRLLNLSTRALAGGNNNLIAGFATNGSGAKNFLVRGIGPGLANLALLTGTALSGTLRDPSIQIRSQGSETILLANDNWGQAGDAAQLRQAFAAVGAFALEDGSADAAALGPLMGGLYTAVLGSPPGDAGIALVEAYDADQNNATTRLINLSARAQVESGDNVLIAGLVIGGNAPVRVLVRGVGPALTGFGVQGALAQPKLDMFVAGVSKEFVSNSGWSKSLLKGDTVAEAKAVGAFPLTEGSADSAILLTLQPGGYTIKITGENNTTGVALVEVYLLP